jgi:hypothetical protein
MPASLKTPTAYQAASAIQEVSQACGVEISDAEALSIAEQANATLPRAIAALQAAGVQVTAELLTDSLCGALADYLEKKKMNKSNKSELSLEEILGLIKGKWEQPTLVNGKLSENAEAFGRLGGIAVYLWNEEYRDGIDFGRPVEAIAFEQFVNGFMRGTRCGALLPRHMLPQ